MIVNCNRKNPLGARLTDYVLVEDGANLQWRRKIAFAALAGGIVVDLVANDVIAEFYALVADEDRRPGDQLADLVLTLAAE